MPDMCSLPPPLHKRVPASGPFRFDYANGRWVYSRDRRDLVRQLEQEIESLVGAKLQLE